MLNQGNQTKSARTIQFLLTAVLVAGSGFFVFKLIKIDDTARHKRLWEEIRVLADLTQRRSLSAARAQSEYALAEAGAISDVNVMKALSLGEVGYFNYRMKKYNRAIALFDQAAEMNKRLLRTGDPRCDVHLIEAELGKLALLTAHCYDMNGNFKDAKVAFNSALDRCSNRLLEKPLDLLVVDRFADSFAGACDYTNTFDEVQELAGKLNPQVLATLTAGYRGDVRSALTEALNRAKAPAQKKIELWNTVSKMLL